MGERTWARRVWKLRKALGLSQERTAGLLKCSTQALRAWEKGKRDPLPIFQEAIAELEKKVAAAEL